MPPRPLPPRIHLAPLLLPGQAGHFARTALAPGKTLNAHRHDYVEVFWIAAGSGRHDCNDSGEELATGDCRCLLADDVHRFTASGRTPLLIDNLAFAPERLEVAGLPPEGLWFGPQRDRTRLDEEALDLLARQAALFLTSGNAPLALQAVLATLRLLLDRARPAPAVPAWLRELREDLRRPEHLRLGLAVLPQLAGRSAAHISRQWRLHFAETPGAHLDRLRVERARELLLQTDLSPLEIADELGYGDLSWFYRRFRARYGCPPQRFRREQRRVFG